MIYIYEINIINSETNKTEHTTSSEGRNQKEAVRNFREYQSTLRQKYLDKDDEYYLGVKRIAKKPSQVK